MHNSLYPSLRRYNEYIVKFIQMQQRGNYSPVSAYEKPDGEIVGFAGKYAGTGIGDGDEDYGDVPNAGEVAIWKSLEYVLSFKNKSPQQRHIVL